MKYSFAKSLNGLRQNEYSAFTAAHSGNPDAMACVQQESMT